MTDLLETEFKAETEPDNKFVGMLLRTTEDDFLAKDERQKQDYSRSLWKVFDLRNFRQLGLDKYIADFPKWVEDESIGDTQDLSPQAEGRRRVVFLTLLELAFTDEVLTGAELNELVGFTETLRGQVPSRLSELPETWDFSTRVLVAMAVLARQSLTRRGQDSLILPKYSLPEWTGSEIVQLGWKYSLGPSSRRLSRSLANSLRIHGGESVVDQRRRRNLESLLGIEKTGQAAGVDFDKVEVKVDDMVEINKTITTGLIPAGEEGALRNYNGAREALFQFPPAGEIVTRLDLLSQEITEELYRIRNISEDRGRGKWQAAVRLAAYACVKLHEMKAFLTANSRTAFVVADRIIRQSGFSQGLFFPAILTGLEHPDFHYYHDAVDQSLIGETTLNTLQPGQLFSLERFLEQCFVGKFDPVVPFRLKTVLERAYYNSPRFENNPPVQAITEIISGFPPELRRGYDFLKLSFAGKWARSIPQNYTEDMVRAAAQHGVLVAEGEKIDQARIFDITSETERSTQPKAVITLRLPLPEELREKQEQLQEFWKKVEVDLRGLFPQVEFIGDGRTGNVYRVSDEKGIFALKAYNTCVFSQNQAAARRDHDAECLSRLYPLVPKYLPDRFPQGSDLVLLPMEYISGESIDDYVQKMARQKSGKELEGAIGEIESIVNRAHILGFVLGDVKQEHFLYDPQRPDDLLISRKLVYVDVGDVKPLTVELRDLDNARVKAICNRLTAVIRYPPQP